jgi:hypothetical protein
VAIVQISRIQVRRGKKNTGTGVPQLASGELGWAIDAQELYIGNGSTQEGAPAVGNTRILTENDNILELSGQYFFKGFDEIENSPLISTAVGRSLQARLDDFVSAANFGVLGDGFIDDTTALQNAIDALFGSGTDKPDRAVLYIPAGTYRLTQPLNIPPFATIVGAGVENTIFINEGTTVFETIGDLPIAQVDLDTQPRYITISNMSIECKSNSTALFLNSCRDSVFSNLKLTGQWFIPELGEPTPSGFENYGIEMVAKSDIITCKNNVFENVYIEKFTKGILSLYKIVNNRFTNFDFYEIETAVEFGETISGLPNVVGPTENVIENSRFELVQKEGIYIRSGDYNISKGNRFVNVGNDGGNTPITSVIKFNTNTNVSVDDYFERTALSSLNTDVSIEYFPEVEGRSIFNTIFPVETVVGSTRDTGAEELPLFKLPLIDQGTLSIEYVYTADSPLIVREGVLGVTVNRLDSNNVVLLDDFRTAGDVASSIALDFRASIVSDSILISIINEVNNLTGAKFYYIIKSKT